MSAPAVADGVTGAAAAFSTLVDEALAQGLGPDQSSRGLRFSSKRNIVCPWHGWEFDIESGRHCGDPKHRLRPVGIRVRENRVYLDIPGAG
jgi:hypothetical protein